MKKIFILLLFIFTSQTISADCVYGAKDKTRYKIIDSNTVILTGGYGYDIYIKTYCYLTNYSEITILKDDFCDYDSSVLYIDGEVCDATTVKKLD